MFLVPTAYIGEKYSESTVNILLAVSTAYIGEKYSETRFDIPLEIRLYQPPTLAKSIQSWSKSYQMVLVWVSTAYIGEKYSEFNSWRCNAKGVSTAYIGEKYSERRWGFYQRMNGVSTAYIGEKYSELSATGQIRKSFLYQPPTLAKSIQSWSSFWW